MSPGKISGSQSSDQLQDAAELRRRAEARLAESERRKADSPGTSDETNRLLHELQVRQIELEMQNQELQQARRELETALEQYTGLYDFAPVGYFTLDRAGTIRQANLTGSRLLGVERSRLVERPFGLFVTADSLPIFNALLEKAYQSRTNETGEISFPCEGGQLRYAHLEAQVSEDGQTCRLAFMDITERKRVEEALEVSEEKLHLIVDATPFPIVVVDLQDNNILFWSRSALDLFGHTAPTTPEWYQIAYPDPDYRSEVIDRWKSVLEVARQSHSAVNTGEYRITCRDGSVRICELYAAFLSGNLIVTFNDITERKQVEDALCESEEKYRLIAESAEDWIYWLTPDQKLRYISPSCERVTGYAPAEFTSNPNLLKEIVHPDDRKNMEGHFLAKNQDEAGPHELEYRIVTKTGEIRWISHTCKPVFDQGGQFTGRRGTNRNITQRKQAETKINEQIEELRRWQAVTLGREDRILELKREINELLQQVDKPPRYPSAQANNLSGENSPG